MMAFIYYFPDDDKPTNPMWYAGLGVPFKLTPNISFAKKVSYDTTSTHLLVKQLERYYGKTFHFILQEDALARPIFKCASCGLGWTQEEGIAAYDPEAIYTTHIGSLLRTSDADSFAAKIMNVAACRNDSCGVVLCGACAPPKRGRNSDACRVCTPSKYRRLG